jgi:hypothetical protein
MHCYDFPKNLAYTLADIEPGSSVPEADAMSTAPRRQSRVLRILLADILFTFFILKIIHISFLSNATH